MKTDNMLFLEKKPLTSIRRYFPGTHLEPFRSRSPYIALALQPRCYGRQGRGG